MIKIQKRLLFKVYFFFLLVSFVGVAILFLSLRIIPINIFLFFIFSPSILISFYLLNYYSKKKISLGLKTQKLQEDINLTLIELNRMTSLAINLKQRIESYKSIKSIMEKLNQQWDLNSLADFLLDVLFRLIARGKGNCILYLVSHETYRLNIFATRKELSRTAIKTKEGDLFDLWVIKHNTSLWVENAKSDFRFDYELIEKQTKRPILSLISCPLLSQERILGIIRLEVPLEYYYNQDDLRLLDTIANFTAVAVENTRLFQQVKELAIKDSLTSCFTKGYFMERLKEEFLKNIKIGHPLSLLMLDIDHFKDYNDKFGHVAGDIVLKELGKLLNELIGDKGMVFRFGGEEFSIILPNTNKEEAVKIGQRILHSIEKKDIFLRRFKTSITVSIGLACIPEDTLLEDELIFKADQCLYQAKQSGRNRLCYI